MTDLTLDHVVIAVQDLDAATADYTALLGRAALVARRAPDVRHAQHALPHRQHVRRAAGARLPARATPAGRGELARFLDAQGEGVYALALGTPDVDATVRELRDRGLDVLDPADGDGIDTITGARREWRNAQVPLKSTQRRAHLLHRAQVAGRCAARRAGRRAEGGAYVEAHGPRGGAVRRHGGVAPALGRRARARGWRSTARSPSATRASSSSAWPTSRSRSAAARCRPKEGIGKPDRLWGVAWGVDNLAGDVRPPERRGHRDVRARAGHQAGHARRDGEGAAHARRRDAAHRAHAGVVRAGVARAARRRRSTTRRSSARSARPASTTSSSRRRTCEATAANVDGHARPARVAETLAAGGHALPDGEAAGRQRVHRADRSR